MLGMDFCYFSIIFNFNKIYCYFSCQFPFATRVPIPNFDITLVNLYGNRTFIAWHIYFIIGIIFAYYHCNLYWFHPSSYYNLNWLSWIFCWHCIHYSLFVLYADIVLYIEFHPTSCYYFKEPKLTYLYVMLALRSLLGICTLCYCYTLY